MKPDEIYAQYPRKIGRGAAIKAIEKAIKKEQAHVLLDKTVEYAAATATWSARDRQFIPHPATWYNQERWTDDPNEWRRGTTGVGGDSALGTTAKPRSI